MIGNFTDCEVGGSFGTIAQAIPRPLERMPDVIVAGWGNPNAGIFDPADWFRGLMLAIPNVPVLALAPEEETIERLEAVFRTGANGCVIKDDPIYEVHEACLTVARREFYASQRLTPRLLQRMIRSEPRPSQGVEGLTNRELVIFEMLGSGLKTSDIAGRLKLSTKTVESHREKIKHRLGLGGALELTHFACKWVQEKTSSTSPEPPISAGPGRFPVTFDARSGVSLL